MFSTRAFLRTALSVCLALFMTVSQAAWAVAQTALLESRWTLEPDGSFLQFQSIKDNAIIETSWFAKFIGRIEPDGTASVSILLDSVDTKLDLRNVRMRFLFFETFKHPVATIVAQLTPDMIEDLATTRRKIIRLPFMLDLHGVSQPLEAEVVVTLIRDDLVSVASATPILLSVADFDLTTGLEKLSDTAQVNIVPATTVSFALLFRADTPSPSVKATPLEGEVARVPSETETGPEADPIEVETVEAKAVTVETPITKSVEADAIAAQETEAIALEPAGNFSRDACIGRFEILSRAGNISFESNSDRLRETSAPVLDEVGDVVQRCPDLQIAITGHTDSWGDRWYNQQLSERRAAAVLKYLTDKGIGVGRMTAYGRGEDQPIATNSTAAGRAKNRRIEFTVEES